MPRVGPSTLHLNEYGLGIKNAYADGLTESQKEIVRGHMLGQGSGAADTAKTDRLVDSYIALGYPQEGTTYSGCIIWGFLTIIDLEGADSLFLALDRAAAEAEQQGREVPLDSMGLPFYVETARSATTLNPPPSLAPPATPITPSTLLPLLNKPYISPDSLSSLSPGAFSSDSSSWSSAIKPRAAPPKHDKNTMYTNGKAPISKAQSPLVFTKRQPDARKPAHSRTSSISETLHPSTKASPAAEANGDVEDEEGDSPPIDLLVSSGNHCTNKQAVTTKKQKKLRPFPVSRRRSSQRSTSRVLS